MEIDFEKLKEEVERQREQKPKTRFDTYQADLVEYLLSKLEGSNVPASTLMEIAQFAIVQTQIVVNDEVYRAVREYDRQLRKNLYRREKRDVTN